MILWELKKNTNIHVTGISEEEKECEAGKNVKINGWKLPPNFLGFFLIPVS